MTLTKEALLAGKDLIVEMVLPGYPDTVKIRPLTSLEWSRVATKKIQGITFDAPVRQTPMMKMDLETVTAGGFEAQEMAVQYGLVEPALTMEEVHNLKPGIVSKIAEKIMEISGLTEEEQQKITSFRPLA